MKLIDALKLAELIRDRVLASVSEEEIFKCLGLEFVPPAMRECGMRNTECGTPQPDWSQAFSTVDDVPENSRDFAKFASPPPAT